MLSRLVRRLRALWGSSRIDKDLTDEIRLHIDMEAADLARSQGLSPNEARRRAVAAFGGVDRYTEAHRDARGVRWLHDSARDARYALRSLRRTPAFTLSAAAVLALGIGSGTAIFSAVDAVLISRLPYPNDDRLIRIIQQNSPTNRFGVSNADYRGIAAFQRAFESIGASQNREVAITTTGAPRRSQVTAANSGFFQTLGVGVMRGRVFTPSDEAQGAPGVVLLSHDFATREYNTPDAALGKVMTIDGLAHTVVGVLPVGVYDLAGARSHIWQALQLPEPRRRGPFVFRVIGRLRESLSIAAARADLAGVSQRLDVQWKASVDDAKALLTPYPLREFMLGSSGKTLWLFTGAVILVLLIAVANVASLTLVRVTSRARDAALRTMLGATRGRLAQLLVLESIILAALGAVLGLALAWGLLKGITILLQRTIPRLDGAALDPRAFAFAALVTLATGLLIGLYPLVSILRRQLRPALGGGDREIGPSRGTHAVRGALVTAQFALALPLLAGAGLLLNSFVRLQRVDNGFDTNRVLYVHVTLPGATYSDPSSVATFWTRTLARVKEVQGVEAAGISSCIPPDECGDINNFEIQDRRLPPGTPQPTAPWSAVDAGYFQALGVPLLDGRHFTHSDTAGGTYVVMVSRAWVERHSSDRPALGRKILDAGFEEAAATIVGIVGDVKYQGLQETGDAVYRSVAAELPNDAHLFVRTAGPPRAALPAVRAAIQSVDPNLALDEAGLMDERVAGSVTPQRHWTLLLGGFALAALVLAAVGIFGMLSYLVTSRQREIGVRVALGAARSEVVSMILRRGMRFAIPGAVAGLVVALLARRFIETSLFDVSSADPLTLGGVTLLLLAVAGSASWLPARRAAAADPMKAIRTD
ncbi:MAG: ADOP family duplicated permease [Gemmatimonadaceae bacterium]